jgi:hypothetical protein
MLYRYYRSFLEYCRLVDFSSRSIRALEIRLGVLRSFARTLKLKSINDIKYPHQTHSPLNSIILPSMC